MHYIQGEKDKSENFREETKTNTLKNIKNKIKWPVNELTAREKISDLEVISRSTYTEWGI